MTQYGTIIDGGTVERAVQATLQTWLPTYLAEVARQNSLNPASLTSIRDWRIVNELEAPLGPKQLPALWLVSPGLEGEPYQAEDTFSASWLVTMAVIVSARDHTQTIHIARLYTAAVRAALTQKPPTDIPVSDCRWLDESYDRGPAILENTIAYGTLTFRVTVDDVLAPFGGPDEPPADPIEPLPDTPNVTAVALQLEAVAPGDDLP